MSKILTISKPRAGDWNGLLVALADIERDINRAFRFQYGTVADGSTLVRSGAFIIGAAGVAPAAHAPTHKSAGTDPIKLDELAAPTNIATLNATAAAHGLLPKLSGAVTDVLRGDGTFGAVPNIWTALVAQIADLTTATGALVNTDLIFNFVANSVYIIDLYLMATSAAVTTGYRAAFDTSVAVTAVSLLFNHVLATTGTTSGGDSNADATARGLSSGVPVAAALNFIAASGILVTGATPGTCRLVFGAEVAASVTLKASSIMRVQKAA